MPKSRKRPSLKDVAALSGTSIATASRALSGTGYVAKETLDLVIEAAEELNYQPDLRARSLRRRSTQNIGLIIPNLLNAYYTALADSISRLLATHGYNLLLSSTRDDPDTEEAMVCGIVRQAVDGLIWVPTNPSEGLIKNLKENNTHAVSIVRRVPGDVLDTVVFEDFPGSKAATRHLINLGHQRIGYIGGDVDFSSNFGRWQGHMKALQEAGLPIDQTIIKLGNATSSWGFIAASDLINRPSPPTAIYVASNAIIPGVLRSVRQKGLKLPEDLSLICFDDVNWFSFSVPPITSVRVGHKVLAEVALNILFRRIENSDLDEQVKEFVEIPFDLVLRLSTAPPSLRP